MAYWDFMGTTDPGSFGANDALAALGSVNAPSVPIGAGQPTTMWDKVMSGGKNFFADPNNIRVMGDVGAALSSGKNFGEAAGNAASANERRKAMQAAGAKTGESQQNLLQQLIKSIVEGDPRDLVTEKGNLEGFDSITFGGDGSFTMKAPGNKHPRMQGAQESLESIKGVGQEAEWNQPGYSPFQ